MFLIDTMNKNMFYSANAMDWLSSAVFLLMNGLITSSDQSKVISSLLRSVEKGADKLHSLAISNMKAFF